MLEQVGPSRADEEQRRVVDRLRQVLDEVEEGRLGPVDVLEHDHPRSYPRERGEQSPRTPEELLDRKRLARQAERRRHARDGRGPFLLGHARLEARASRGGFVVLSDARGVAHYLGERPERDALAVRQAPAAVHSRHVRDAGRESVDEMRLPGTRVGDRRDEAALARLDRLVERRAQDGELSPATDEGAQAATDPSSGPQLSQPVRRHRLGLPLQPQRLDGIGLDRVADQPEGQLTEEDLHRRGGLLESRRRVDGVAGHHALAGAQVAGDHLARVHAGAVLEAHAPRALELVVELLERELHAPRGANRPERVVLMRARKPEHRHDRVADELLDRAPVLHEHTPHLLEVPVDDLVERLGVEPLAEHRRPLQVGEDDRHGLPHLGGGDRGRERSAAEPAQPESVRVLLAAGGAGRHATSVRPVSGARRSRRGCRCRRRAGSARGSARSRTRA